MKRKGLYFCISIGLIAAGCVTLGTLIAGESKVVVSASKEKKSQPVHTRTEPLSLSSKTNDPLLILVNKDNPLPKSYSPRLRKLNSNSKSVAEVMYDDLKDMLVDGRKQGLSFCVASAHRSSERQQEILNQDIKKLTSRGMSYEDAYRQVTRTVMPPGYSEHETGLAVDITAVSNQRLDDTQKDTPENKWLRENCSKYGFILRYPKGKEDITGIDYESWHFRYVGKDAAKSITSQNLTLEEYLQK